MTTILFLHGWNSVPGGVKPTYLATHGHAAPPTKAEIERMLAVAPKYGIEIRLPGQ